MLWCCDGMMTVYSVMWACGEIVMVIVISSHDDELSVMSVEWCYDHDGAMQWWEQGMDCVVMCDGVVPIRTRPILLHHQRYECIQRRIRPHKPMIQRHTPPQLVFDFLEVNFLGIVLLVWQHEKCDAQMDWNHEVPWHGELWPLSVLMWWCDGVSWCCDAVMLWWCWWCWCHIGDGVMLVIVWSLTWPVHCPMNPMHVHSVEVGCVSSYSFICPMAPRTAVTSNCIIISIPFTQWPSTITIAHLTQPQTYHHHQPLTTIKSSPS